MTPDDDERTTEALVISDTASLRTLRGRVALFWRRALPAGGRDALKQILILFSAFVAYDMIRIVSRGREVIAIEHSQVVIDIERALGFFWEPSLQSAAIENGAAIDFLNWAYSRVHLPAIILTLTWIYLYHYRSWSLYRNAFLIMNAIGVTIFALLPLAPPRLVAASGMVDTKYLFTGEGVHSGALAFVTNPYAAMPSLHFGYALFTSVALWSLARGAVMRLVAVAYAVIILIAIVATGNHYLLDGLAGAGVLALAFVIARAIAARGTRRSTTGADLDRRDREASWD